MTHILYYQLIQIICKVHQLHIHHIYLRLLVQSQQRQLHTHHIDPPILLQ